MRMVLRRYHKKLSSRPSFNQQTCPDSTFYASTHACHLEKQLRTSTPSTQTPLLLERRPSQPQSNPPSLSTSSNPGISQCQVQRQLQINPYFPSHSHRLRMRCIPVDTRYGAGQEQEDKGLLRMRKSSEKNLLPCRVCMRGVVIRVLGSFVPLICLTGCANNSLFSCCFNAPLEDPFADPIAPRITLSHSAEHLVLP